MPIDLQPTLHGTLVNLRPVREDDLEALYAVASDPELWALHPQRNRWERPVFEGVFREGLASGGMLVATDPRSEAVLGSSRFYDLKEDTRALTIGYTFVARSAWGSGVNAEMKRLMLDHAFSWAQTVWFYVGVDNLRSRRAVEKLGATFSHTEQRQWVTLHALYALSAEAWQQRRTNAG